MRWLLGLLCFTLPCWGQPAPVRVVWDGADLRVVSSSPLESRARVKGRQLMLDVAPARTGRVPPGVRATQVRPGQVRLVTRWDGDCRCIRSDDGKRLRVRRANSAAPVKRGKLVTLDLEEADICTVIRRLAGELRLKPYIGPEVEGRVTARVIGTPPLDALRMLLWMVDERLDSKVVENGTGGQTLLVATPCCSAGVWLPTPSPPPGAYRNEFILEKAPAARVMEGLAQRYPTAQITAHPLKKGFYVYAAPDVVAAVKAEIPALDVVPVHPPPPHREVVQVESGDIGEVKALLATLLPDVSFVINEDQKSLTVTGSLLELEAAKELLGELDRPEDVVVNIKLIDLSEQGRKMLGLTVSKNDLPAGAVVDGQRLPFVVLHSDSKVLAAPRVPVTFGTPALYRIGDSPTFMTFDPRLGTFTKTTVELGWTLEVTARTLPEGRVALRVRAAWSRLDDLVSGQYPVVSERVYEHEFELADEQAVVISGLLHDEDEVLHPAVRDTSILGTVFGRNESPHTRNREIVCVISPRVAKVGLPHRRTQNAEP